MRRNPFLLGVLFGRARRRRAVGEASFFLRPFAEMPCGALLFGVK
jgi:hypothetical protein